MTTLAATVAGDTDLAAILQAYHGVTERLKRSHDALAREVCRLREELHEKNKALLRRERLSALGEMAAGVAHEIRNPLGGIGLYASLLERDLSDRPRQLDITRRISAGVRNLDGIVSDILAFAGDAEPNRQAVSMGEILDSALVQTAPRADALGVEIDVDSSVRLHSVCCDPAQIERALINLILNALDSVGERGHVWIRSQRKKSGGGPFSIVIEDDGPGIDPEQLHRVFDPFFTTKDTGTGLGLAIVHRIAESNGGCIRAGNRSGGGAAFVLSLPLADAAERPVNSGGDR